MLNNLVNAQIETCMEVHGFRFPWTPTVVDAGDLMGRYGPDDESRARTFGYGSPRAAASAGGPDTESWPQSASESQAFLAALQGNESDWTKVEIGSGSDVLGISIPAGCAGAAYGSTFGTTERAIQFQRSLAALQDFENKSLTTLAQDPEYLRLNSAWARCMATTADLQFESPLDSQGTEWSEPRPSEAETRTAIADVRCKRNVDYVNQARLIEQRWQEANFTDVLGDLEFLSALYDQVQNCPEDCKIES